MKSLLRGIKLILTLDCEGSARLTSEGFDRNLTIFERIAIRMHNAMCKKSRRLAHQLRKLNEALKNNNRVEPSPAGLSPEAKQRIQALMEKELQ